jgi:ATP-dependent protease ClpP protease subunit
MAEILLYGIIGDSYDKLDAKTVCAAVREAKGPLSVRINSPGGFVMEGLAIIAALRDYRSKVTIYIDGLAASMASAIACVGAETIMAESALWMMHKPWDSTVGNADEMRRDAANLDRVEQQLIGIYAKRSGLAEGEIAAMLAAETWLTPEDALAQGFVTSIAAPLQIAAMADVSAYGFRHVPDQLKDRTMPPETPSDPNASAVTLERTRISTIIALGTQHRLPATLTQDLISRGVPLDQARASMLDHLAAEGDRQNIGHTHGSHQQNGGETLDNPTFRAKAMGDAVAAKLMNKPAEGAATEYRAISLVDMARDHLSRSGVRDAFRLAPDRIASMALSPNPFTAQSAVITHTTSDFPQIMQAGIDAALIERYKAQESPLKQLTSPRDVPDFKDHYGIQMSGFGSLDHVNEAGEYKNGTLNERGERYKVDTYGKIINFSRQMLVNDSLGALSDIVAVMARAAAELEAQILAATINSNIKLSDNKAWFHADHGNLAGSGAALSVAALDAARLAMRSQKDMDGVSFIDAAPKFLLVPVGLQTTAETLVAATQAPGATEVNPFAGKLTPVADPRLTSPTAWYLFADPNFSPAFVSVYLSGQRVPYTDSRDGWRVDGIEYKVRHDFGAGVLDAKMAYKNPGA